MPHRRTAFDLGRSSIEGPDAQYLAAAFHLIDEGVRVRVVGAGDLSRYGSTSHAPAARLGELRSTLDSIDPPPGLEEYHEALLLAFDRQRAVFETWQAAGTGYRYGGNIGDAPEVRAASQALQRAYGELMRRFGAREPASNAEAFFDYHCALDFI